MKNLLLVICFVSSFSLMAHEGGHGDVAEGGKFGGTMAPVIDNAQAGMGAKAKTIFKGELVRTESGKLSLYLFDEKMNLIDLAQFGPEIEAKLEVKKKGKFTYLSTFKLTKHNNHFMGNLPKIDYKPFNVDLFFMRGSQKLFVGFTNLD